ncbi:MAG: TetR/AcrR family transcriptional regulator [Leptospira sp.]|jgi:TetR/AcrR family transcriptional regulator, repressor of fatR-cypB operon|nr:TetR/AcrR family transcriptional regulator [Leptospira sp.]NCS92764.1 TetR/AcrR family transcriptional regulator [Leptospira sp.]
MKFLKEIPSPSKKEQIILTAMNLFSEQGFDATPMPKLAEIAGVGTGTIYRYFPSKEILLNEIYRLYKLKVEEYVLADFDKNKSVEKKFKYLCNRWIDISIQDPKLFSFLELQNYFPYLDEDSLRIEENFMKVIVKFIKDGQKENKLVNGDPILIFGMVTGAITKVFKTKLIWTEISIKSCVDLCWKMVSKN